MKSLLWLLAVFAAAVALVILGRVDAGYALFVYPPYRVEMSMLFFAIALLAAFLALYTLFRLLSHAIALPAHVRVFRARRRRERAHAALAAALQAYYEGRYARAEKEAAEAFDGGPAAGVAALLAARASHQMRDFERRDRWLERAEGAGEGTQAALGPVRGPAGGAEGAWRQRFKDAEESGRQRTEAGRAEQRGFERGEGSLGRQARGERTAKGRW